MRRASTHDITVCETNLHPELTVLGEGGSKRKKNRARIDSQTRHLCYVLVLFLDWNLFKSAKKFFFSFELWAELIGRDHLVSTYFTLHSYKCGSSENYLQTWFIAIIHYDNICWLLQTLTEKGSYIKTFQLKLLFFTWTLKRKKKFIWSRDYGYPMKVSSICIQTNPQIRSRHN